jgi:S1-C subfamily serine protease
MNPTLKRTLPIVFAAAVVGGLAGAVVGLLLDDGHSSSDAVASAAAAASPVVSSPSKPALGLSPEAIYRRAAPAVVVITDTQTTVVPPTLFTPGTKQQVSALGSGFVVDKQGDIVTNDHVVQGATGIRVGFSNGASYPAKIVGTDPSTDVAVVRVKAPAGAVEPITFDDSAKIEVGDPVYAIGNPFGLDRTMTAGIVSATGRDIESPNGLTIPNAIQTDAPINHGNSGGPLLDRYGRVIGVNAQIEGGTVNANVGVGFAIPSDTATSVAREVIESGHAKHAWLGVRIETINPSVAAVVRGLPTHGVVVVQVVKHSPAAKAGLKPATSQVTVNGMSAPIGGDAIVSVDGKAVDSSAQLADTVALRKPGERLKLEVVRRGKRRAVEITLGNVPAHS